MSRCGTFLTVFLLLFHGSSAQLETLHGDTNVEQQSKECPIEIDSRNISFSPQEDEMEIRNFLKIGDLDEISDQEIAEILGENGIYSEIKSIDMVKKSCSDQFGLHELRVREVHFGPDETGEFSRSFAVISTNDGKVRLIEKRYAYKEPTF